MAGAITNLKDKRCPEPCGVVFTPNSGRQKFHSKDPGECPARKADTVAAKAQAKPATARKRTVRKPAAAKVATNGSSNGNGHTKPGPEILSRLIGDCDRELAQIDEQLRPLLELQAQRREVERVRDTLASV